MFDEVTELAERGRALAPEDRERLVDLLLESLPSSSVQEVEIARRDAEIESGKVAPVLGEEVVSRLRAELE